MRLKTGRVVNFKRGNSLAINLVKFRNLLVWEEPGYTHSGIITRVEKGRIEIAEALTSGFTISWYDRSWIEKYIKEKKIIIGRTIKPLTKVREYAKKYEGRPYAWFDIINIVISWILGRQLWLFRIFRGSKHLICSEAVARILYDASNKRIDFEREFKMPYDMIEPMHLYNSSQIDWQDKRENSF